MRTSDTVFSVRASFSLRRRVVFSADLWAARAAVREECAWLDCRRSVALVVVSRVIVVVEASRSVRSVLRVVARDVEVDCARC